MAARRGNDALPWIGVDVAQVNIILVGMAYKVSLLLRALAAVLVLSLSLGAMPCGASTSDDPESQPPCCLRNNTHDSDGLAVTTNPDGADIPSLCLADCTGCTLVQVGASASSHALEPHGNPPVNRIDGRSIAPEPFPPKVSLLA